MSITKVCVVGAGTMGSGIAQAVAQSGCDVAMLDVKQDVLDSGLGGINGSLGRMVKKGTI